MDDVDSGMFYFLYLESDTLSFDLNDITSTHHEASNSQ